jgi:hypothetical protein
MREASIRVSKYKGKFSPAAVSDRFSALKDLAGSLQEVQQTRIHEVQSLIRSVLNEQGISPLFTAPYMSLGMKILGLEGRFDGACLDAEVAAQANLWVSRGCDKNVVNAILVAMGYSPLP